MTAARESARDDTLVRQAEPAGLAVGERERSRLPARERELAGLGAREARLDLGDRLAGRAAQVARSARPLRAAGRPP